MNNEGETPRTEAMMDGVAAYRKKPVEVEAIFYDGKNGDEVSRWAGWMTVYAADDAAVHGDEGLIVTTLNGTVRAFPGEWIVKGVEGEFYPCKHGIFEATYEAVPDAH